MCFRFLSRTRTRVSIASAIFAGLLAGVFAGFFATSSEAAVPDRLAVLMFTDDPSLADNLVEVAISHLSKRGDQELVGERELRGRLAPILPAGGLAACVAAPTCLASLGDVAHVERVVIGNVRRSGDTLVVDLALVNTRTGETEGRSSATVPADEARLIAAIRSGIDHLFAVKSAPPSLAPVSVVPAAPPEAGQRPPLDLAREDDVPAVRRRSVLPYVGWGAGAVAVVSLSAAAVTGSFATAALSGTTRAEMQADLKRRQDYATTADVLIGAGTTFAVVAVVTLYRWWRGERSAPLRAAPARPGLTR